MTNVQQHTTYENSIHGVRGTRDVSDQGMNFL